MAIFRLQDDGWWEAEVLGKSNRPGLAPSNFLKEVQSGQKVLVAGSSTPGVGPSDSPQNTLQDSLPSIARAKFYALAMYMYKAAIPEELSFAKGDILRVWRLQDDGWWEAEVVGNKDRGLAPSNYLERF